MDLSYCPLENFSLIQLKGVLGSIDKYMGKFFNSVLQLLLAEREIRCLNLSQQHALLAAANSSNDELPALDSSFASISATNHLW